MEHVVPAGAPVLQEGRHDKGRAGGSRPRRLTTVLWLLGVLTLLALAYHGFFSATYFTLDDFEWMCFCKYSREPLTVLWRDSLAKQFFRPVGELWYMAIYALAGNDVLPYQIGFLVVHLLNGVLAAWLASRLVDSALGRCVGLLFTLNAVFMSYISLRFYFIFDTLGFSFYLVSLAFLILAQSKRPVLYGTISLAAALVSYFTKEAYYTLPGAAVLVLGTRPGEGWSWQLLRRRWRWLVPHVAVWGMALGWRTAVIEGLGGYGLATIHGAGDLARHLVERGGTWLGFAGWSLFPALARPSGENYLALVGSACLLGGLTVAAAVRKTTRPWVVWSWSWMLITWAPSLTMISYAPVSWYAPAFGSSVLALLTCYRSGWAKPLTLLFACYLSWDAMSLYEARQPYVRNMRRQQAALEQRFSQGGQELPPHTFCLLLNMAPDLHPDPIIKHLIPQGAAMPDVFFLNPPNQVMWIVTNNREPADLAPFVIAGVFQKGYFEIGSYRAYTLVYARGARTAEAEHAGGRGFLILKWTGIELISVAVPGSQPQVK